ncbi:MAG: metal ABC transporter substrate-binding protein, partial [Lachnospiraceae bacterium]|nr:metal ABC transporter substrate-binding protein [Lachnospiraceae bacterium]
MFRRKLGIVFCIMLAFSLVSLALVSAFGKKRPGRAEAEEDRELVIAASFYPVWVIVENVCAGVEGVRVVNLTQNHTGCLHDYQLTAADMLTLETADILVINGGDMELFVTEIVKKLPGLPVVDACRDISLLEGSGHSHEHEEAADGSSETAPADTDEVFSDGNRKTGFINTDGISSNEIGKTASAGADRISSGGNSEVSLFS